MPTAVDIRISRSVEAAPLGENTVCCSYCLEIVPADIEICPECGEPPVQSSRPLSSARPLSIPDDAPDDGWLKMHWRPLLTIGAIGILLTLGIALRYLAPNRYTPPEPISVRAKATPVCDSPCWHGEACQDGECVWQSPNSAGHITPEPMIAGPFTLPSQFVDVLPLDPERIAVSSLIGVHIYSARTGGELSLISDAPLSQQLYRVGTAVYATSPRQIYVIDAQSTDVLKTIEIGSPVESIYVGASGMRVLASVPGARSVAVISTEYHAEINRFFFGDDQVGPVAIDDTGRRGLTTTGRAPLPGVRPGRGAVGSGALYAFDPSRLPSTQDRVRAGMRGNPADIMMVPDAKSSYVVLRDDDSIVPLEHLPTGAVRQGKRLHTCRKPEQIELIRRGRRAIVRCGEGRFIDVFSLQSHKLLKRIQLKDLATDLTVSPDSRQAIVVMTGEANGSVGLIDLDTYQLTVHDLAGHPHRVRLAPSGDTAVVVSNRSKSAWVIR